MSSSGLYADSDSASSSLLLADDSQAEGSAPPLSPSQLNSQAPQCTAPPFLDLSREEAEQQPPRLGVQISGWVEVFNRELLHPQLAYCVQVSCRFRGEQRRWTTFRTQRDFDDLFGLLPQSQDQGSATAPLPPPQRGLDSRASEIHQAVEEAEEGVGPDPGMSPESAPEESPGGSKKVAAVPRRKTNFSTVSARHQCSPDQSVHLMSLRLKFLMGETEVQGEGEAREREQQKGAATPPPSPTHLAATDLPKTSPLSETRAVFLRTLSQRSLLDVWFLQSPPDGSIEKFISPAVLKRAIQTAIVSRALWDTHWREEIAVLYPTHVAFYSPLAKKASWTLSLQELIGISHIADDRSPLLGKAILKIETIGRVHYLAFASKESCNALSASILEHFSGVTFENSLPSFVDTTDPRDRFVLKSGRWRPSGRRLVLNARKFSFDVEPKSPPMGASEGGEESLWEFSARLLKTVFQLDRNNSIRLSPETLKREQTTSRVSEIDHIDVSFGTNADGLFPGRCPPLLFPCSPLPPSTSPPLREKIISFLDETVRLKLLSLQDLDLSSPEALCFFVNIYHTLLIHARLVLNPPSTQVLTLSVSLSHLSGRTGRPSSRT
jgi:hypothetical protein